MPKFKQSYLKPTEFNPKGHWMVDIVWPVKGSKDNVYDVTLHDRGFTCDCPGFSFRGRCKHSQQILRQVEGVMR
tara:strand:- start:602 stop:823 length:222 start_codon:yes stop_codon:yes gene_type:complete